MKLWLPRIGITLFVILVIALGAADGVFCLYGWIRYVLTGH